MLVRGVASVVLGIVAVSLSGCAGFFGFETREAWRGQAEKACLRSGAVRETEAIRITEAIDGPGICGLDHPVAVAGIESTLPWPRTLTAMQDVPPAEGYAEQSFIDGELPPVGTFDNLGALPAASGPVAPEPLLVAMSETVPLACPMVPALARWLAEEAQPAALAHFGSPIVEMITAGSYNCRKRNNARRGKWSEHAFANAIDVSGFRLADGRVTMIGKGWRGDAAQRGFWRDVVYGGCRLFTTVLGPGSDGKHEKHLHLDLARHASKRYTYYCRPLPPRNWVAAARQVEASPASLAAGGVAQAPEADLAGGLE